MRSKGENFQSFIDSISIQENALYEHVLKYNKAVHNYFQKPLPRPHWPLSCSIDFQSDFGSYVSDVLKRISREYELFLISDLHSKGISGSLIEFGVYRGERLNDWLGFLESQEIKNKVFGFDSFQGLPPPSSRDYPEWEEGQFSNVTYEEVAEYLRLADRPQAKLLAGWIEETMNPETKQEIGPVSFLMLDLDLYEPTKKAMEWIADSLSDGAIVAFDDWTYSVDHGETAAFFEWVNDHKEFQLEFLEFFAWRIYFRLHKN